VIITLQRRINAEICSQFRRFGTCSCSSQGISQGSIAAQGKYSELQATGLDFAKLLNDNMEEGAHEQDQPLQKMLWQMSVSVSVLNNILSEMTNCKCKNSSLVD
jgi:hypothetical protein